MMSEIGTLLQLSRPWKTPVLDTQVVSTVVIPTFDSCNKNRPWLWSNATCLRFILEAASSGPSLL
jgi:hypothetical protein